ncbi:MAG: hypothetical protein KF755_00150 [Burkholderiaceae bacterium]|nr:hypothetical protein [Burkholderiaceae bacterium]
MRHASPSLLPLALIALGLQGADAFAQAGNPHNGTWKMQFDATNRVQVQGTVDVKDDGGAWKTEARDSRDPCAGREAPIVVRSATPEKLVFRVIRSKVLAGCPDFSVTMNRVDDNNLQGAMGNGWKVQMTRQ